MGKNVGRWQLGVAVAAAGLLSGLVVACGGTNPASEDVPEDDGTALPDGGADTIPDSAPVDWGVPPEGDCVIAEGEEPDFTHELGCTADFENLASYPLDASIPGARSSKTVIDTADGDTLYFTRAEKYPMHYEFCKAHLSGNGKPGVGDVSGFNATEYYSPYRRFLLGAVTYYAGPKVWVYEIAPYDTASAEMVTKSYDLISGAAFFGGALYFHPTSESVAKIIPDLPEHVKVITTDDLFAGVTFLPLNLGVALGQLRFFEVEKLEAGDVFVTARDIAVLDSVPNDISVVAGLITAQLQTPLSHVNVLSQNRGTPNMSLIGAMTDPELLALENQWVRLTVTPFEYSIEKVTKAEADAWWEEHKPPAVKVPELDLSVKELTDVQDIDLTMISAFGGKASHYGVLSNIEGLPVPDGFAVPVYFYKQFEALNGFDKEIELLLADPTFQEDIAYREAALKMLRDAFREGKVSPEFENLLLEKLETDFPGVRMRFRSSTNAEDLDGFTGAGLYTSKSGDPNDPNYPVLDAVRDVYASLWNFRAFEERSYRGIDHTKVAMALLVHRSFADEDANGVALTNNIFDPTQPAFYVNVQLGEVSVVLPPQGTTAEQFLYYFSSPGKPISYLGHSSLVPAGETVLTKVQVEELGKALDLIHVEFAQYYYKPGHFYAMDVEFKFNTDPEDLESKLWVKQARPHPGWWTENGERDLEQEGGR